MKNLDIDNYRELSSEEMSTIKGGDSIAFRIGQFVRYYYIHFTQGEIYAQADFSVNYALNKD